MAVSPPHGESFSKDVSKSSPSHFFSPPPSPPSPPGTSMLILLPLRRIWSSRLVSRLPWGVISLRSKKSNNEGSRMINQSARQEFTREALRAIDACENDAARGLGAARTIR